MRDHGNPMQPTSRVFLGNLSYSTTVEEIREELEAVCGPGTILDIRMSQAKDYAHVTLASPHTAAAAVEAMDGFEFRGRRVLADFAPDKSKAR